MTDPINNPLAHDRAAEEASMMERVMIKAAQARSTGDWFDIFDEITNHHVVATMEAHGDSAVDALKDWKDDRIAVRREFVAHGTPLSEEVEIEGPEHDPARPADQTAILWPNGQQLTIHWPDGSRLVFRGRKAVVALSFLLWWQGFQASYKIGMGRAGELGGQSRIIAPGSAEHESFYKGKPG